MITVITSGELPASSDDANKWEDVLEVPGSAVVNYITVINEGDFPGWWRLVQGTEESAPARLPAGGGESGERKAGINIPCKGFSGGKLQIKKGLLGGNVSGVFAFGMA